MAGFYIKGSLIHTVLQVDGLVSGIVYHQSRLTLHDAHKAMTQSVEEHVRNIVKELGDTLVAQKLMLSTAESCTGGWIAQVITALPGQHGDAAGMGCDRQLVEDNGNWTVKPV